MFGYRSNNWGWFDHPPLILKESHWGFSACRITWFEPDLGHVSFLDSHDLSSPSPTVAHLGKVSGGRVSPAHSEAPFRWHTEERWLWLSQALGDEITPWSGNGNRVLADDFPIFCHSHFAKRGCAPCTVILVANDFPMFFRSCCFPEKVVPPSDHYYCLLATPHQLEQLMLLFPQSGALWPSQGETTIVHIGSTETPQFTFLVVITNFAWTRRHCPCRHYELMANGCIPIFHDLATWPFWERPYNRGVNEGPIPLGNPGFAWICWICGVLSHWETH